MNIVPLFDRKSELTIASATLKLPLVNMRDEKNVTRPAVIRQPRALTSERCVVSRYTTVAVVEVSRRASSFSFDSSSARVRESSVSFARNSLRIRATSAFVTSNSSSLACVAGRSALTALRTKPGVRRTGLTGETPTRNAAAGKSRRPESAARIHAGILYWGAQTERSDRHDGAATWRARARSRLSQREMHSR